MTSGMTRNLISCSKCNQQHVGETENALNIKMNGYCSNITTKKPVTSHFNRQVHSLDDLRVMGIAYNNTDW